MWKKDTHTNMCSHVFFSHTKIICSDLFVCLFVSWGHIISEPDRGQLWSEENPLDASL